MLYGWAGRKRWFFHDEWHVLIEVDGGDAASLLSPTNEHWTTLPMALYRVLFNVFGLNSYLPYQMVTISCHLLAAALLRVVMRRAGVSPWMATLAACVFLLFGAGDHNILRAFQVTFIGALVFGLVHLLLADHDGKINRWDWLGLVAGLAALMCSGVGVAMVAAVSASALIRRGWRAALFHAIPLVAIYLLWFYTYGNDVYQAPSSPLRKIASFALASTTATFDAIGHYALVGALLGLVLVVGLALAWSRPLDRDVRRRGAATAGLLFGGAVFIALTAWSRAELGAGFASQSRYVHIIGALCLPALALAADTVARRGPSWSPPSWSFCSSGSRAMSTPTWNQTGRGRGERTDRRCTWPSPASPRRRTLRTGSGPTRTRHRRSRSAGSERRWPRAACRNRRTTTKSSSNGRRSGWRSKNSTTRLDQRAANPLSNPSSCISNRDRDLRFTGEILVNETARRLDRNALRFRGGARGLLEAVGQPLDLTVRPDPRSNDAELCA